MGLINKIKRAVNYWGIIPSAVFGLIILSQIMVIVGAIGSIFK